MPYSRTSSSQSSSKRRKIIKVDVFGMKLRPMTLILGAVLIFGLGGTLLAMALVMGGEQRGKVVDASWRNAEAEEEPDRRKLVRDQDAELLRDDLEPIERVALGHRAATSMDEARTFRLEGTLELGGKPNKMQFFFRQPNLVSRNLTTENGVERIDAHNGRRVWTQVTYPNGEVQTEDLTNTEQGREIIDSARLGSRLLEYFDQPDQFRLVESPEPRFSDYTVVAYDSLEHPEREELLLLDPETLVVRKQIIRNPDPKNPDQTRETVLTFRDYRDVGNTLYPFSLTVELDGKEYSELSVDSAELN
ncbi:MAG: hypothetical protein ACFB21_08560, partial [Opitutales bacterium]